MKMKRSIKKREKRRPGAPRRRPGPRQRNQSMPWPGTETETDETPWRLGKLGFAKSLGPSWAHAKSHLNWFIAFYRTVFESHLEELTSSASIFLPQYISETKWEETQHLWNCSLLSLQKRPTCWKLLTLHQFHSAQISFTFFIISEYFRLRAVRAPTKTGAPTKRPGWNRLHPLHPHEMQHGRPRLFRCHESHRATDATGATEVRFGDLHLSGLPWRCWGIWWNISMENLDGSGCCCLYLTSVYPAKCVGRPMMELLCLPAASRWNSKEFWSKISLLENFCRQTLCIGKVVSPGWLDGSEVVLVSFNPKGHDKKDNHYTSITHPLHSLSCLNVLKQCYSIVNVFMSMCFLWLRKPRISWIILIPKCLVASCKGSKVYFSGPRSHLFWTTNPAVYLILLA